MTSQDEICYADEIFASRKWKVQYVHWKPNNKRNETDSCILRKTCYWDILVKGFSVQKKWEKTISSALSEKLLKADKNQWIIKPKGLLIYNPQKTIICEAQAKKAGTYFLRK